LGWIALRQVSDAHAQWIMASGVTIIIAPREFELA
jgi:hypothetical protein